jgi:hypothetical protein
MDCSKLFVIDDVLTETGGVASASQSSSPFFNQAISEKKK